MIYFWTRYSYIPWHNDRTYDGAITIYMNKEWKPDFGGYFMYAENSNDVIKHNDDYIEVRNIKAIIPKKNLAVLQTEQTHHCTTPVNFFGDLRVTIQTFLKNK